MTGAHRLANEKSPYLLQHQGNPVDWFPWGREAFEKARAEDKPIFLSVGYSTCHWCHVMAHESFEDPEVAALLRESFVSIKVDREERPDVDRVYMTFVQATTGSGGWPMSVWLTPDLRPFLGGTYFPPTDRYGRPGFKTVLQRIAEVWRDDRAGLLAQGERVLDALRQHISESAGAVENLTPELLEGGFRQIARQFDPEHGGFGGAPKFPRPVTLNFLLRYHTRSGQPDPSRQQALEMALHTLRKMAAGGMRDHLGGGFHRYSVDTFWHVPHFEKMLYDQAQIASACIDAFQITREPLFEETARSILDYVARDMTAPSGGFYSAEDADSLFQHGSPEHGEGAFYVWSREEIDRALAPDAAEIFRRFYGVETDGNAPGGSDPQREFEGKNILIQRHTVAEVARLHEKDPQTVERLLREARTRLLEIRANRPRPHLDDKILTAWNGLMISAFARAAQAFDAPGYLQAATRAARFVRTHLLVDGRLHRSYREGTGDIPGFADDYASLIQALLDLYETGFDIAWLQWALELQKTQDALFADPAGGYFSAGADDPHILLRLKEDHDGAEPSPSSVTALNLLRLSAFRADNALRADAERTLRAFTTQLSRAPSAMPQMLVALDRFLAPPQQIVIAGDPDSPSTLALLREVRRSFLPRAVLILADGGPGQEWLASGAELLRSANSIDGRPAAYVCENFTCRLPVTDPARLRDMIGE